MSANNDRISGAAPGHPFFSNSRRTEAGLVVTTQRYIRVVAFYKEDYVNGLVSCGLMFPFHDTGLMRNVPITYVVAERPILVDGVVDEAGMQAIANECDAIVASPANLEIVNWGGAAGNDGRPHRARILVRYTDKVGHAVYVLFRVDPGHDPEKIREFTTQEEGEENLADFFRYAA